MKAKLCKMLLMTATGFLLVLLTAHGLQAQNMRVRRIPLGNPAIRPLSISSAPGYCSSNGGSHDYEYILDAQYTQMTEDTISISVEIYIANPTNCTSGSPCPVYENSPEYINAWIDWNGNRTFEESERVINVALTGYTGINYYGTMSTSTIVTVPADAPDLVWMRVNLGWDHDPNDPCESSWVWGDIIDKVVSPRNAVPRISQVNVTGIPDAKNPLTSDASVSGVEKVKLEAVIAQAEGYEVTNVSWSGDVQPGQGNPYEYIADPGSHAMKYVTCAITYRDTVTNETWTDTKGRNFKLFFSKSGDDNGDGEPNWFTYWKSDEAVPDLDKAAYDPTLTAYGMWSSGRVSLGPSASGQHYSSAITLSTHFGSESFGGPAVKGIDCAAEVIAHELYHKWVTDQWASGGQFNGKTDSDKGVCTGCNDRLPDTYETNTSFTKNDSTDTYDLEHAKHSDYKMYGDQEYMAMRTGNGVRGIGIRDWAYPGKQSDPPYGCHSLKDYAPVNARLTGYFSDKGIDTDGDALYEYLKVLAEINVTDWGAFRILGRLIDQDSNEITWINRELILYPGTHLVSLDFDGLAIREHGANGPYRVSIFLDDEEGLAVDHRGEAYATAPFSVVQFDQRDARFSGTYKDQGTDTNADGRYDFLTIDANLDVQIAGDYIVEAGLFDGGSTAIQMVAESVFLNAGMQTVRLNFSGLAICRNRADGPFYLKYLGLSRGGKVDFVKDAYTTAFYGLASFEKADARLSGIYSDHGTDADGNGAYDYLTVDAQLDISAAGKYTLTGWLYDADGAIVKASHAVSFGTGLQAITLDFDGRSLYLNGVNGPYYLRYLTLHNQSGLLVDAVNNAYTTGFYNYTGMQHPLVGLTGSYADFGTDADADGKFDSLNVELGVLLSNPGYCVGKARLIDANGQEIAWAETIVNLGTGPSSKIRLDFDGKTIYEHGVNGPYYVRDVYVFHVGDPFKPAYLQEAYTTGVYQYCQFGDCLPVADAGPDRTVLAGPACMSSVDLDGTKSFDPEGNPLVTFTWTWSLNGNSYSVGGATPSIDLPLGNHTVSLVVSDGSMDSKIDTVDITVVDGTPPNISLFATPDSLWPPDHNMVLVGITVSAPDNCDPNPSCKIVSILSNEPQNGLGDGDKSPDWLLKGDLTTELRAERSGTGKGRIYTIDTLCADSSGNSSRGSATVTVPLNQKK